MTACKDSLSGKKAVSATLAGVLAVGMVPAAAFAETAQADTTGEQGIELQATDANTYEAGEINEITYYSEFACTNAIDTAANEAAVATSGEVKGIAITSITPKVAGAKAKTFKASDWENVKFAQAPAGKTADDIDWSKVSNASALPTTPGTWYMQATAKSDCSVADAAGAKVVVKVTVSADTLAGTTVKFKADEANKYTDKLVFDGTDLNSKLEFTAPDGTVLSKTNADIAYKKLGGDVAATVLSAGDYVAEITGKGVYANQRATVKFSVSPLDLSTANIVVPDTTEGTFAKAVDDMTIDGKKVSSTLAGLLNVAMDTTGDKASYTDNGEYTVTVSASATAKDGNGNKAADSIVNTKSVKFNKVGKLATFEYNGTVIASGSKVDVDLSVKNPAYFAMAKVKAYTDYVNSTSKGTAVDDDSISIVSVTNKATGAAATEADLKTPGTWIVTLGVDHGADYAVGGTAQMTVNVTNGTVKAASVFVSVNGENIQGGASAKATELEYTGENLLDTIDIVVSYKGKDLVEGTDYTVEVTKDGKKVDEIVNAGTGYQIEIKSDTYTLAETAKDAKDATIFKFDVTPVKVLGAYDAKTASTKAAGYARIKDLKEYTKGETFLPHTGEAVTPEIEYIAKLNKKGEPVWKTLPADQYKVVYKDKDDKIVDEIVDEGTYSVAIRDANAKDNYQVTATTFSLKVSSQRVFKDVPNGEYFTDSIYKVAQDSKYAVDTLVDGQKVATAIMSGYNGGDFFGPYNELTRAETATLIGRLAGVPVDNDDAFTANYGYTTPFSDVAQGAWYANAVAWSAKAGVVTGFGNGTFGPDQSITREQFALMLYRYAEKCGYDTTADAKALASLPDASGVSDWAKTAVEWAVSKGFIGQGGTVDAQGTLTRGMAATIMVRFMDANIVK